MTLFSKLAGVAALALLAGCATTTADAPAAATAPAAAAAAAAAAPAAAAAAPAAAPTPVAAPAPVAPANPDYVTIRMEIDVAKPAADVWAKVGKDYCALGKWIRAGGEIPCTVTKGDGGIGSVRSIANGAVIEVLTAKTDLSYGYTQPAKDGKFYDLYHGFLEAKPIDAKSSKLIYTLMYDVSNLADQAAKDADVKRRRTQFEGALANMKKMAEG
jgi:hypothetical protein